MVSVHFVTPLVFILGAAVVRMKAVRRLCYCSGPATRKCLSRWRGEPLLDHSGCRAVGGAAAKFLKAPTTWQSPTTECPVCKPPKY